MYIAFTRTQAEWPSLAPGTVPEILGVNHLWVSVNMGRLSTAVMGPSSHFTVTSESHGPIEAKPPADVLAPWCNSFFSVLYLKNVNIKQHKGTTAPNYRFHISDELCSNWLTDVEGIKHIAGPLRVVPPTPEVDDVIQQHGCVAITHIWHLTGTFMSPRPHWRQLRPA